MSDRAQAPVPTIAGLLRQGATRLTAQAHKPAQLEAEILLASALGEPRTYLHTWPDRTLPADKVARYLHLLEQRLLGWPIAYLSDRREFWSLDLRVGPQVLIPRPETELLVESVLARLPADESLYLADLGTGSGAIALALASERPRWRIVATDISRPALALARHNARRHNLRNLEFRLGNWFEPLGDERFDALVSNPPYVAAADPHLGRGDLRFEPALALACAGEDGLAALRTLVGGAPQRLRPGGWLFVEHGYQQQSAVAGLFQAAGFRDTSCLRDLSGHPRCTQGAV